MPRGEHGRRKRHTSKNPPTILILAGIVLLLVAVFVFRNGDNTSATASALEAQLDQALVNNRPTLVFLHSLDCIPCKAMMQTVADVYPGYQDSIVLIDVDIYDQRNANIVRRERLQSIPTLVFYSAQGARQVFIGAMPAEQFSDVLTQLAAGQ
jgi:thioredoxin-like negative regulator of GroEL